MHFAGSDIAQERPYEIKRDGISYIPQEFNVFPQLTVAQNLKMGAWVFRGDKARLKQQLEYNYELFPALYKFRKSMTAALTNLCVKRWCASRCITRNGTISMTAIRA